MCDSKTYTAQIVDVKLGVTAPLLAVDLLNCYFISGPHRVSTMGCSAVALRVNGMTSRQTLLSSPFLTTFTALRSNK